MTNGAEAAQQLERDRGGCLARRGWRAPERSIGKTPKGLAGGAKETDIAGRQTASPA